ncbi:hypothetical protein GF389_01625 [Candidatus Dojkabacteria bacterium]|nr:hypothetical protein [Candidatus Dojkabacteria bacterium]
MPKRAKNVIRTAAVDPIKINHCPMKLWMGIIRAVFYLLVLGTGIILTSYAYLSLGFENLTSYWFFLFVPLILLDGFYVLFLFDQARRTYYLIGKDTITYTRANLIFKRTRTYKLDLAVRVISRQGIVGRIFNCGNIEINDPATENPVYLRMIPEPSKYRELIEKRIRQNTQELDPDQVIVPASA